jgi:hypothetical protein
MSKSSKKLVVNSLVLHGHELYGVYCYEDIDSAEPTNGLVATFWTRSAAERRARELVGRLVLQVESGYYISKSLGGLGYVQ